MTTESVFSIKLTTTGSFIPSNPSTTLRMVLLKLICLRITRPHVTMRNFRPGVPMEFIIKIRTLLKMNATLN